MYKYVYIYVENETKTLWEHRVGRGVDKLFSNVGCNSNIVVNDSTITTSLQYAAILLYQHAQILIIKGSQKKVFF